MILKCLICGKEVYKKSLVNDKLISHGVCSNDKCLKAYIKKTYPEYTEAEIQKEYDTIKKEEL